MKHTGFKMCWVFYCILGADLLFTAAPSFPLDKGNAELYSPQDSIDLAAGIIGAGALKHTVYNNGQLGIYALLGWLVPELPCGWYKGYGYVANFNIWVGIPEGPWNPHGLQGPTVSESMLEGSSEQSDWGPRFGSLGWLHSGDVVVGDLADDSRLNDMSIMATSTIPETWPEGYLDQSGSFIVTPGRRHWPGPWMTDPLTGLEIEGTFTSDEEVHFSITDEGYAGRDDQIDQGFPIGIQLDFSALSFDELYAEDIIFFEADLINNSPHDYSGMYIGLYFDADVEDWDSLGLVDDNQDWMKCLIERYDADIADTIDYHLGYIYDYRPPPNWRAYTGVSLLKTPNDTLGRELGLTDWHWFDWFDRPGAFDSRKELIQYKVLSGDTTNLLPEEQEAYFHPGRDGQIDPHYDDWELIPQLYPEGLDCVFLMSTGPFSLTAHETTRVAFALIMGDDEEDLIINTKTAHALYNAGFEFQDVILHTPSRGDTLSGVVEITWEASSITGRPIETVELWSSRNAGGIWHLIMDDEENDGSYLWNTVDVPDGTRYLVRVTASDGLLPGEDRSNGTFVINNPGQAVPEVLVLSPNGGETIRGAFEIEWWAQDADGDPLSVDIEYSPSNGSYWETVARNEENDGSYIWDTWNSAVGDRGSIRITVTDGESSSEDRSNMYFSLYHERSEIDAEHIAGHGNGEVHILVIDPADFTGHTYQLLFSDNSDNTLYHVFDETTAQYIIRDQGNMTGTIESPYFDGLRVLLRDWPSVQVIDSLTGWTAGNCNWTFEIQPYQQKPADYELRFTEDGDTSSIARIPVPFHIYNLTEQRPVDFMLQDNDHSGDWSSDDMIIFAEPLPFFTWRIALTAPFSGDTVDPEIGDILSLTVTKPFTSDDVFAFSTSQTVITDSLMNSDQPKEFMLFQNYPNPFNPSTDIKYQIRNERAPAYITLKIYNMLGQEVKTLVDEVKEPGYYTVTWDGRDTKRTEVASGVYIYRLAVNTDFRTETKFMILIR